LPVTGTSFSHLHAITRSKGCPGTAVASVGVVTRRVPRSGSLTPVSGRDAAHRIANQRDASWEGLMDRVVRFVKSLRAEEGQDLLEYALLVALIALVAYAAVQISGIAVNDIFTAIAQKLQAVA
jgi:Flp pilus assembly pilin Flp